jgi:hypothetical protein
VMMVERKVKVDVFHNLKRKWMNKEEVLDK